MRALAGGAVELIARHQHPSGAYPACPTFPVYRYSWFRDGAFIAEGASRGGDARGAGRFHDWCAGVLTARAGRIEELVARPRTAPVPRHDEFLPARYTLDGGEDHTDGWWNFQLDGYGTWLWALSEHVRRQGADPSRYAEAVRLTVRYLARFHDTPCYDWWEEHPEQVHVSTLGAVFGGLGSALDLGVLSPRDQETADAARRDIQALVARHGRLPGGGLAKWPGSDTVDAALLACLVPFGLDDPDGAAGRATLASVERALVRDHGVHRYRADTFYGGGRWPVLAALLGWVYARTGRPDEALAQLAWMASTADGAGELPEQVGDPLLHPERREEWVERWGEVARPLLWSHGMFLILADELGVTR
ncbi:glycoside hydrolase family 15 [Sphaerisporangium album]|uniref:Glycoside hydrolase family 15 n=2 Tax=Sphaerisporangium album TaxID=509200 RepID=A0A367ETK7_9ACTN|nr:glycoside hydrolase family 15 [Sphaerisporangium album]